MATQEEILKKLSSGKGASGLFVSRYKNSEDNETADDQPKKKVAAAAVVKEAVTTADNPKMGSLESITKKLSAGKSASGLFKSRYSSQEPSLRELAQNARQEYEDYIGSEEHKQAQQSAWQQYNAEHKWDGLKNALMNPTGAADALPQAATDLPKDTKAEELKALAEYYEAQAEAWDNEQIMKRDLAGYNAWPEEDKLLMDVYILNRSGGFGSLVEGLGAVFSGSGAAQSAHGQNLARGQQAYAELVSKYGEETVRNYAETVERYKNAEITEAAVESARKNTGGFWGDAGRSAASVAGNAASSITGPLAVLSGLANRTGRYSTMDPNSLGYLPGTYAGEARQTVVQNIEGEDPNALRKGLSYLYQGGMSAADNILRVVLAGGNGTLSLGLAATGSFGQTVQQASGQGASPGEAILLGTASAGLEVLTEKIPLDNLLKQAKGSPHSIGAIIKNVLLQGGIEATTEEVSLLGSVLAEAAILQEKSGYNQQIGQMIAEGMSHEEAVAAANQSIIDEAVNTLVVSWVSGSMSTGAAAAKHAGDSAALGRQLQGLNLSQEDIQAVVQFGLESEENTDSYRIAAELQKKIDAGKKLSNYDLGALQLANTQAFLEEQRAEQEEQEQEDARNKQEQVAVPEEKRNTPSWKRRRKQGGGLDQGLQAEMDALAQEEFEQAESRNQQKMEQEETQELRQLELPTLEDDEPVELSQGTKEEAPTLTQELVNTNGGMHNVEGYERAERSGAAQPGGAQARAGAGLLHGSRQWNDGQSAREQAGAVAGSTADRSRGRTADRFRASVDRQNRAKDLRKQGLIQNSNSLDLGLVSGTEAKNILIMPQEYWDQEMSQLADRIYNETGKRITYVMGSIQVRGADKKIRNVRGVINGDNIIVQADNFRVSMEQIADHEAYHAKADWGRESGADLNSEIRQHIIDTFSEEEYRAVLEAYVCQMRGVYDVTEARTGDEFEAMIQNIEEEVLADACAGINAFGAHAERFTEAVRSKMAEVGVGRQTAQENGVRQTNGPNAQGQKENTAGYGGEKYSVENEYLNSANLTEEELQSGISVQRFIDQVSGMVNKAIRSKRKLKIGSVSRQHARVVDEIMHKINPNFSADGYELWIDGTGATHIEDRHGENGQQDQSMASDEAKILIPWASQNASSGDFLRDSKGNIKLSGRYFNRDQSRAPEIYLEKQIDNDTIYVSECVPDSANKRIWITSAYIKKGSNGQMLNVEETSPQLTPEAPFDGNATTDIVTTPRQLVKKESGEDFSEQYGLKLPSLDEAENSADSQALENDQEQRPPRESFSLDDSDSLGNELTAEQQEYFRDSVDDTVEQKPVGKKVQKPVAESKPIIAKRDLQNTVLNLFSIPSGQRAELGGMIGIYADRLIKNGSLTEEDRKNFFDRMYESGVMTVPADEYYAMGREYLQEGRIYVPDSIVADFGDDWNDVRRRAFAAGIYLTRDKSNTGIDVWNGDLAEMLPGLFDSEETDQRSILERILQVAEAGKDEKMSLPAYTARLAETEGQSEDEFLENMERQLDWALRTFAEKADLEIKLRDRTGVKIAQERGKSRQQLERQRVKEMVRRSEEREVRKEMAQRQRERKELREMQQKTLKTLRWLSKNRDRAPEELREAWDEVLGDIDIYAIGAANEMRWSEKHGATWKDLAQMYRDAQKNDPNFLPSKELEMIVARLDGAKIADMDLGALQDLYKAAIGLRTEFYNRNNVVNDEMHRLFAEVYTDAKRELESAPGGFTGKGVDKFLNMEQLTPMNILQRMGGWDPNGTFYSMAKQLEKGERDVRAYTVKAKRMLQDFLTEHADWVKKADGQGKDAIWYEVEVPQLLQLGMGDKPIFGDTVKVYMTPAQKVHMYLESKNLDNLRHMAGGRTFAKKELYSQGKRKEGLSQGVTVRLAPETVRKLVADLTPEEMELAQLLDRYYNTFATQEINRVSNTLYGYDKAMGKNYAPIYTNQNYNKKSFDIEDTMAEHTGSLKQRINAGNPSYNISAFDAFERHVDRISRFCGMAIPTRNWDTLLNWRVAGNSTRDVITHKWGDESKEYIDELIKSLQGGEKPMKQGFFKSLANSVQYQYISAIFGANPSIVLKQLGSIPMASAYLGARNVPTPAQVAHIDREFIAKYTQDLAWRTMGYSMPETKQLKDNPNWTQTNKFFRFTFGGGAITAMDGWAASVLWPWAENKVRREFPELEMGTQEQIDNGESPFYRKVAEEFEDALARSQSTSDEIHQSSLRKSKDSIDRAFTMFRSDSAQTYNAIRQKIGEAQYYARTNASPETLKAAKRSAGNAVLALLANASWVGVISFLMALWKNKGKNYRDEEDELSFESVAGTMAANMVGSVAGIVTGGDELAQLLGSILLGDRWYGIETSGMEQLNDVIDVIYNSASGLKGLIGEAADVVKNGGDLGAFLGSNSGEILSHIKEVSETAAMYFAGLPASNVETYLLGLVKWVSPELATAYEDAFASIGKSDLAGLEGEALMARAGNVLENRGINAGDSTVQALAQLYEAGYKKAFPSDVPSSVSIDGESRKLGAYQQQTYDKVWSGTVADVLDEIVSSDDFRRMDEENREKVLSNLYSYAADLAKSEVFEDYETGSYAKRVQELMQQGQSLADAIVLSSKMDSHAVKDYLEMTGAGMDPAVAETVITEIEELEPAEGAESVSDVQKWRVVIDSSRNDEQKMVGLFATMSEAQYTKVDIAYEMGVSPDAYVTLQEIKTQYDADGNGSFKNAEIQAAIDGMGMDLTSTQKAILWQLATGSTSTKGNPYDKQVGQQVIDARAAAKAKAEEPEAEDESVGDALMKQLMGGQ